MAAFRRSTFALITCRKMPQIWRRRRAFTHCDSLLLFQLVKGSMAEADRQAPSLGRHRLIPECIAKLAPIWGFTKYFYEKI